MASVLDDYLAQIEDTDLKAKIQAEFEKTSKTFGLVFERHQQEGIKMPGAVIELGAKVAVEADDTFHTVVGLDGDTATLVNRAGDERDIDVSAITVAREFGDIMYPGLKPVQEIRNGQPGDPVHTVINGENYHALEMLKYTHKGKVDLIYVDPPYNTGNKTWKYNDRYVNEKDSFRHSKWLSFMEKRLLIAKELLTPTGFLVMSIDDSEQARLKMLADQVLGASAFVTSAIWKSKSGGANDSGLAVDHEYVLVYRMGPGSKVRPDILGTATTSYSRTDERGAYGLERLDKQNLTYGKSLDYDLEGPDGELFTLAHKDASQPNANWRWSRDTVRARMDELVFENGHVYTKNYQKEEYAARSLWVDERFGRTRTGGTHLAKVLGRKAFDYPKPLNLLSHIIRIFSGPDAIILDFFGGSGTTAEAVMQLNVEDGGSRQAILVTNNELSAADDKKLRAAGHAPGDEPYEALGVFHHVTRPRISTVVTGTREDGSNYSDGLAANVAFFDLQYLDRARVKYGHEFDSLAGVFWLRAGAQGPLIHRESLAQGFAYDEDAAIAVLFRPGRASQLAAAIAAAPRANLTHVFIVTESDEQGNVAASYFPTDLTVERIYGSYLSAFQVNKKD